MVLYPMGGILAFDMLFKAAERANLSSSGVQSRGPLSGVKVCPVDWDIVLLGRGGSSSSNK